MIIATRRGEMRCVGFATQVTNQQLFLDRSGRWNLDLKSNAEEGIKVPATLDFPGTLKPSTNIHRWCGRRRCYCC